MKTVNCKRWRLFVGVTVVSALAIAVSVQGGPRDGSLRTERGAKAGTSRLLSGSADTIRSGVVAGVVPTAILAFTPVADSEDGAYGHGGFYSAADISGQRLTVAAGGGRIFFNFQLSNWGTAFPARAWQGQASAMGLLGSNADCGGGAGSCGGSAGDLTKAVQACGGIADCIAAFNDGVANCDAGVCDYAWVNIGRSDWIASNALLPTFPGCGVFDPAGALCFGAVDGSEARVDLLDGFIYYGASVAYDVPADAKGLYTISLIDPDDISFIGDDRSPPQNIPLAAALAGEFEIPVGSCCIKLGLSTEDCIDDQTKGECEVPANAPFVWTAGKKCSAGCIECLLTGVDPLCNDLDACTDDACTGSPTFVCTHTPIAGWDSGAGQCCDAGTGDVCSPSDANTCSVGSCSILAGNRGTCIQNVISAGDPCTGDDGGVTSSDGDANPCTFGDLCQADQSCVGTDVTSSAIACLDDQECKDATGLSAPVCVSSTCECSLVPDLTFAISALKGSEKADPLCFNAGSKITATVDVAAATAPVNGGQFLITYDPSCMSFNSVSGAGAYTDLVFGPVVDEAAGTIFIVVGVGFGVGDGPAGNASMLSLSFTKSGDNACDSCNLCFDSNNPENTFMVDNTGQRIGVNPICSDTVVANNVAAITVPDNIKTNVDCGQPDAVESWDAPAVTDSCGTSALTCMMQHQNQTSATPAPATGGTFIVGATNFCCWSASDWCDKTSGSPGSPASAASDTGGDGCWTVEVNDQTTLDITIGLSPSSSGKPANALTRCIKFTLYENTIQAPQYFSADVEFGAEDILGKSKDALKIPGHGNWDCITAWDQLHTLRSCYLFSAGDCAEGGLSASFRGDPAFGGNWLIGGNLDGWKKSVDGANPSLFVIDVLDYGTFVNQFGNDYGSGDTPCGTDGPNADIDGDGLVTVDDYAYISMNFLATSKFCCGVDGLPAGVVGVTSISIADLRRQGDGDLVIADLNGDGVLSVDDMNAFMQGARPSIKSGSLRKGTR